MSLLICGSSNNHCCRILDNVEMLFVTVVQAKRDKSMDNRNNLIGIFSSALKLLRCPIFSCYSHSSNFFNLTKNG